MGRRQGTAPRLDELVAALAAASGHQARKPLRRAVLQAAEGHAADLAEHLDHDDDLTRWEVVNLLGELRDPAVAARVVAFALAEDEVHARWRSFWAVTRFDRATTVPLLLDGLAAGVEPACWRAALVLSMLGRPEAAPRLLRGLDSRDAWIQWEALSALKALRVTEAVPGVIDFLEPGRGRPLRHEATLALGAIGGPAARAALEDALDDVDPEVRWRASCGLARIGDPASIPRLRSRLAVEVHDVTATQLRDDIARMEAGHGRA